MEEKIKIELTSQNLEIIYRSLLEMPAKIVLPVIQDLERQVNSKVPKEEKTE